MSHEVLTRSEVSESSFISKVYLWMAAGLGLSALSAFWLLANLNVLMFILRNPILVYGVLIANCILAIWMQRAAFNLSAQTLVTGYCAYSLVTGLTFAILCLQYTGSSLISTFAIASGTFLFFAVYGSTTKRDLTNAAGLASIAFFGLIIAMIVNFFVKSSGFDLIISLLGVAIMVILIAWKNQELKAIHVMGFEDESVRKKHTILGALMLYIALINLFLFLLNLFGRRRD